MNNPIPVIGSVIVNTPYFLLRQIMSVDYPVNEFIIINNNGREQIDNELNKICDIEQPFIKRIKVCHLPGNIGCAAAWNLIIKAKLMSPYWIITNHDIVFEPGLLKEMVTKALPENVGMVHGAPGEFNTGAFDFFLIKEWVIQKIGLFDENFYPAYVEDCDYIMRLLNAPFERVFLTTSYLHGCIETGYHQTIKKEPEIKDKIDNARFLNEYEYMDQKWGKNWHFCNPYKYPFNNKEIPNTYTTFDLEFNRKKYPGF